MDYMEIPRLRLNRAIRHLNEFIQEADKFLATNPFDTATESYTENGKDCLRLVYKVHQEPPKELGVIAGDCIHNLRAILDNVIWSLGQAFPSGNPKARSDKLSFPICNSIQKYQEKLRHPDWVAINSFPIVAQTLIESFQPYHSSLFAHRISVLHALWNADKHKSPDLMGGASGGVKQSYNFQGNGGLSAGLYIRDGKMFGYGELPEGGSPQGAKAEIFNIQIMFQENGPASGFVVSGLLYELIQIVHQEIISKFEPIFPPIS
jgi:hypothetical protein